MLSSSSIALRKKGVCIRKCSLLYESLKILNESLTCAVNTNDVCSQQDTLIELGNTYIEIYDNLDKDFEDIEAYNYCNGIKNNLVKSYGEALLLAEKINDKERKCNIRYNLGLYYSGIENDYKHAMKCFDTALSDVQDEIQKGRIHWGKGELYIKMGKFKEALLSFKIDRDICNKYKHIEGERDAEALIGETYLKFNDPFSALIHMECYLTLARNLKDDSIHQQLAKERVNICKQVVEIYKNIKKQEEEVKKEESLSSKSLVYFNKIEILFKLIEKLEYIEIDAPNYTKMESISKKIINYCESFGLVKESGDAYWMLSRSFYGQKKFNGSISYAEKAFRILKNESRFLDCSRIKNNIANAMEEESREVFHLEKVIENYELALTLTAQVSITEDNLEEIFDLKFQFLNNLKVLYIKNANESEFKSVMDRIENVKKELNDGGKNKINDDLKSMSKDRNICLNQGDNEENDFYKMEVEVDENDDNFNLNGRNTFACDVNNEVKSVKRKLAVSVLSGIYSISVFN